MITAMAYPEAKRGRGNIDPSKSVFNTDFSSAYLKHARHVLRNNIVPEGQQYPDRAFAVMAGTLRKMAERIQARAIRRYGELLKQIEPGINRYDSRHDGTDIPRNRTEAATQAGISERQKVTALRIANIPDTEFDALIESDSPPTVTKLAEIGKQERKPPTITPPLSCLHQGSAHTRGGTYKTLVA